MVESLLEAPSTDPPGVRAVRTLGDVVVRDAARGPRAPDVAARAGVVSAAIERALRALTADPETPAAQSAVAEWLLDNTHVLRETRQLLAHDLPPAFTRVLPWVRGRTDGRRRVDLLATAIASESGAPIDGPWLAAFVEEVQGAVTLTTGELWALPAFIRLALLEDLARVAARNVPSAWPEGVPGGARPEAADEMRARRAVLALRELAGLDWKTFVEDASRVERILRDDPGGSHPRSDFETRDRTRKAVEEISRGSPLDEEGAATLAVEACRASTSEDAKSRHVAWHLLGPGRAALEARAGFRPSMRELAVRWVRARPTLSYLGLVTALAVGLLAWIAAIASELAGAWGAAAALVLALVPSVSTAVAAVNVLLTTLLPPRRLPRLEFSEGIPDDARTLVVVPVLLAGVEEARGLLDGLERDFVGNEDRNVAFALLTDFRDADEPRTPADAEILAAATGGVERLNARHGRGGPGPFLLLHRARRWNEKSGRFMGWERKRGKLHELLRMLLDGDPAAFPVRVGDPRRLAGVRYVLTRDADTCLPPTCVAQLVATMAHPLNRAVHDADGRVTDGYGVLQPRLEPSPLSARRTPFTRAFAGDRGLDPYSTIVSDLHHDLFGEGNYAGKGLLDVAAFERSLERRVPDDALLSHDLFEGLHARTGLVTDVVLLEDVPADVPTFLARAHRWIRGDWQLLPWLGPTVPGAAGARHRTRFGAIGRWKLLENLRRSLFAPSLVAAALAGWGAGPRTALAASLAILIALAVPIACVALSTLFQCAVAQRLGATLSNGLYALRQTIVQWAVAVLLLPLEAYVALDAIARTIWRLAVSRRRLLEWTPAAHTERHFARVGGPLAAVRRMAPAPLFAVSACAFVAVASPPSLPMALPLLALWFVSPILAHLLGQPSRTRRETVPPDRRQDLRMLARRTWLFFERFVGPDDHWLPPDNFQEEPGGRVARRTSPTNVGLFLLSTLGAHDLGYIGLPGLEARLRSSFDTLDRLERHRGHFYNWYETVRLTPLEPRYVSAVDSGNLVACLWALATGCEEGPRTPVVRPSQREGMLDTIDVLRETLARPGSFGTGEATTGAQRELATLRARLDAARAPRPFARLVADLQARELGPVEEHLAQLAERSTPSLDPAALGDLRIWTARLRERVNHVHREIDTLAPCAHLRDAPGGEAVSAPLLAALAELPDAPRLEEVPAACAAAVVRVAQVRAALAADPMTDPEALVPCDRAAAALERSAAEAGGLAVRLRRLATDARRFADEADFTFLYDPKRRLLHLGYDASAGRLDANHYDLLASESRLASFVAIAKGDLPARHWLHLGRPLARVSRGTCLRSWSGTSFEYLMPDLLLRSPPRTILGESGDAAVAEQIDVGRRRGSPWGVSESGLAELDAGGSYAYRAFGTRSLGLKRDTGARYVVAPYACLLALTRRPGAVLRNLERLRGLGMLGRYGLYEALDYGSTDTPRTPTPVRSYMAHHEGMILLSLCNALHDDRMVARLSVDARVRAFDLLLDERVPVAPTEAPDAPAGEGLPPPAPPLPAALTFPVATAALPPRTTILSNGTLSTWITATGAGGLRWREIALTRWREDGLEDAGGTWVYLQDETSGATWSVGDCPVPAQAGAASARFGPHVVELSRREDGILARLEIAVAPWDDVEVRRITLVNEGDHARRIRVTTATEVVLAAASEVRRHPAFARLFVESEILPELDGIHVRRRPKSADEAPLHLVQCLVGGGDAAGTRSFETDRGRFLGRHGTDRDPAAVRLGQLLGVSGATLDPIVAISTVVSIPPGAPVTLILLTGVAGSRERAIGLVEAHRGSGGAEAVLEQARRERERAMRDLGMAPTDARVAHDLLSACLAPYHGVRADPGSIDAVGRPQSGLWGHGISGDLPIVLLRMTAASDLTVVLDALRLHACLSDRGAGIDLVFLDEEPSGYASPKRDRIEAERERLRALGATHRRGETYLVPIDRLSPSAERLLEATAAVVLDDRRPLRAQLEHMDVRPAGLPPFVAAPDAPATAEPAMPPRPSGLLRDNGFGGVAAGGREYVIRVAPARPTPAPWGNMLANPQFGCFVSESGSGWTWSRSSAENRLTPWRNDPVRDDPGEALYLRDEESGVVWTPTTLPMGGDAAVTVRHAPASTTFARQCHGLKQELVTSVAWDEAVKIVSLRLENLEDRPRRLTATYYAEWVLGTARESTAPHLLTAIEDGALLARNPTSREFGDRVAFLASDAAPRGATCDRLEFLGRGGIRAPDGLTRIGLSGAAGGRLDPCAALQVAVDVPAGATREVRFFLGQGCDRLDALRLVARHRTPGTLEATRAAVERSWNDLLGVIHVSTPEPDLDLLLNGRLLNQVLACRMWGRSSLYQPGGAFGFRDQLQDAMALVSAAPELTRAHLIEAARHQFVEGDVLHWWLPETGAGVRTRCSDDRLWLPFAVAHYVRWTADTGILREQIPFLAGQPLEVGERERYARYGPDGPTVSLEEHCLRALERDPGEGSHGLPLIGSCDWNDGMDRVGAGGRGESVWLGWFLYAALTRFAPLCTGPGGSARAEGLRRRAEALRAVIEKTSWDGRWYLRAFYDDGSPLGGSASTEARIDLVSQAWAVLSGAANRSRAARAMASASDHLAHPDRNLVLLLAPPFDKTAQDPGYVKGYPPGVRENGAQYTHAAIWGAWAFAVLGDGDTAMDWFRMLSPFRHASTRAGAERYRVEPYVLSGDVCAGDGYDGRGGWSWYTGSAAWLYRLGLERILGVRRHGVDLVVDPCIPAAWPHFEVTWRRGSTVHHVRVENPNGVSRGVASTTLDGRQIAGTLIPFADDGLAHEILVVLGHPESEV